MGQGSRDRLTQEIFGVLRVHWSVTTLALSVCTSSLSGGDASSTHFWYHAVWILFNFCTKINDGGESEFTGSSDDLCFLTHAYQIPIAYAACSIDMELIMSTIYQNTVQYNLSYQSNMFHTTLAMAIGTPRLYSILFDLCSVHWAMSTLLHIANKYILLTKFENSCSNIGATWNLYHCITVIFVRILIPFIACMTSI